MGFFFHGAAASAAADAAGAATATICSNGAAVHNKAPRNPSSESLVQTLLYDDGGGELDASRERDTRSLKKDSLQLFMESTSAAIIKQHAPGELACRASSNRVNQL